MNIKKLRKQYKKNKKEFISSLHYVKMLNSVVDSLNSDYIYKRLHFLSERIQYFGQKNIKIIDRLKRIERHEIREILSSNTISVYNYKHFERFLYKMNIDTDKYLNDITKSERNMMLRAFKSYIQDFGFTMKQKILIQKYKRVDETNA